MIVIIQISHDYNTKTRKRPETPPGIHHPFWECREKRSTERTFFKGKALSQRPSGEGRPLKRKLSRERRACQIVYCALCHTYCCVLPSQSDTYDCLPRVTMATSRCVRVPRCKCACVCVCVRNDVFLMASFYVRSLLEAI